MPATSLFISYRRDDSAGYARAVYDELARRFGAEHVFMDVDDIDAGHPFAEVIRRAIGESALLLVLIGPRWLGERAGQPPRIAEAGDLVRIEVAAALAAGVRVIPLLLDGTPMPSPAQLPDDLRALAGRNALELDNSRFAADIERLVAAVREAIGEPARAASPPRPTGRWALIAVAVLAGAMLAWWLRGPARLTAASPTAASAAATSVARAAVNGEWQAEVTYDWPNARYNERFVLGGEGVDLHGSASFLGVPRGVLEGRLGAEGISFVTLTQETGSAADVVHRYRARLVGDELRFVMQTEGGSSAHVPVSFAARRVAARP